MVPTRPMDDVQAVKAVAGRNSRSKTFIAVVDLRADGWWTVVIVSNIVRGHTNSIKNRRSSFLLFFL